MAVRQSDLEDNFLKPIFHRQVQARERDNVWLNKRAVIVFAPLPGSVVGKGE